MKFAVSRCHQCRQSVPRDATNQAIVNKLNQLSRCLYSHMYLIIRRMIATMDDTITNLNYEARVS